MGFGLYWWPVIVHSVHWQINFVRSFDYPESQTVFRIVPSSRVVDINRVLGVLKYWYIQYFSILQETLL